jgi:hypothetical protein
MVYRKSKRKYTVSDIPVDGKQVFIDWNRYITLENMCKRYLEAGYFKEDADIQNIENIFDFLAWSWVRDHIPESYDILVKDFNTQYSYDEWEENVVEHAFSYYTSGSRTRYNFRRWLKKAGISEKYENWRSKRKYFTGVSEDYPREISQALSLKSEP